MQAVFDTMYQDYGSKEIIKMWNGLLVGMCPMRDTWMFLRSWHVYQVN